MSDLTKYNAAKRALAEARSIDEVKDIRDKAAAMRLYAMQAKDRVLIDHATEIRLRAERRAGELLTDMEKNKGARGSGSNQHEVRSRDATAPPKLSDLNINKSQSSRWQRLADIPDDDFEELVARAKHKACAAVDRAQQPSPKPKPRRKRPAKKDTADIVATCVSEVEMIVRAATRGMDAEERARLFGQLESGSSRESWPKQRTRDAAKLIDNADSHRENGPDHDRWIETTH